MDEPMTTLEQVEAQRQKALEALVQKAPASDPSPWLALLDHREQAAVGACVAYATFHPSAGLPGHSLMLLVARLVTLLNQKDWVGAMDVAARKGDEGGS